MLSSFHNNSVLVPVYLKGLGATVHDNHCMSVCVSRAVFELNMISPLSPRSFSVVHKVTDVLRFQW